MDWKSVHTLSLFLLVLSQVILGNAKPTKESQDGATTSLKRIPEPAETRVVYLTERNPDNRYLHNESSVTISRTPGSEEESAVYQIDSPITVKKIRRRLKAIRFKVQNATSDDSDNQVQFLEASNLSDSEESLSAEETRSNDENTRDDNRSSSRENDVAKNENFNADHFIPSEDFPKKIAPHSRQGSLNSRSSRPAGNSKNKHGFDVRVDSSEDTSRSDFSSERFGERKRKPSIFNQQSQSFSPDSQKVSIVKEKTVHSTSSEAAQERVNIEKHPHHNQPIKIVRQQQQPRSFPSPQIIQSQPLNNENQKILLIQGTHVPGRNYGPDDDTFGFYANANAYKDARDTDIPPQINANRKVKVVKVIKTKPENKVSAQIQLNNHNDGQSLQYFVSEHPNTQQNKGFDQQHSKNQFSVNDQTSVSAVAPSLHGNTQKQFHSNNLNVNSFSIENNPVSQNTKLGEDIPQTHLQSNNENIGNYYYMNGDQPVMLNINPDPNELYIDENTGQLIKFIIIEDSNQPLVPHTIGNAFGNENPSQNVPPQHFSQPEINLGAQIQQKEISQQNPQSFASFGQQNLIGHVSSNINVNHQGNVQHVPVSGGSIFHVNVPNNAKNPQRYQINQHDTKSQILGQNDNRGISDSKDDSEEYVLVCDQNSQDYSAEYQSQNLGAKQHGLNTGEKKFRLNLPQQNQLKSLGHNTLSGSNHNKGQSFQPGFQNENLGYNSNSGNHGQNLDFQQQNLNNNNAAILHIDIGNQGHYKGSEFSNVKNSHNFALPDATPKTEGHYKGSDFPAKEGIINTAIPYNQIRNQGHHKSSEFSNNQRVTNFATPQSNIEEQNHYKGTEFSQNEGGVNLVSHHSNTASQGHFKGSEFSNNEGINNYATPQITKGSSQGHYKGTEFSKNQVVGKFPPRQFHQQDGQGQYKGNEFINNEGVTNYAPPQINDGNSYKGSPNSNYKSVPNFIQPETNIANINHHKGTDLPINKGLANSAISLNNEEIHSQNKGSGYFSNKGQVNFAGQRVIGGAQGHFKGTELSNNKGNIHSGIIQGNKDQSNYGEHQDISGAQGHYKGTEFSNNGGNSNFEVPHVNTGSAHFVDNKGITHVVTPQVFVIDSQTLDKDHSKGLQHSKNNENNNYAILQLNVGSQGHHKGSDFNRNKNIRIPPSQSNIGGQVLKNKGVTNFGGPQNNIGPQGLYKGSDISSQNQGSKLPVYRETVTPAYPVATSFFTMNGHSKTSSQKQGNYKGSGIAPSTYDTELGISNQKRLRQNIQSNREAFNAGYNLPSQKGNNKGTRLLNEKGQNPTFSTNQNYGSNANVFSSGISTVQKDYNTGGQLKNNIGQNFVIVSENDQINLGNQEGYKGSEFPNKKGNAGFDVPNISTGSAQFVDNKGVTHIVTPQVFILDSQNLGKGHSIGQEHSKSNEGYTSNTASVFNNQRQNFGGNSQQKTLPLSHHTIDSGNNNQKGYNADTRLFPGGVSQNRHPNNPQFSGQVGYKDSNEEFSSNQALNTAKQSVGSHSPHGGQGDLVLLIQKGYNAESDIFPPDKARQLFSSKTPIKSSIFPNQEPIGINKDITNYQSFSIGKGASPTFTNKDSQFLNNNQLYGRNSNSGNKAFSLNQGYNRQADGFANNNRLQKGTRINNNLKEIPLRLSQNTGYNNQVSSVPAFQKNTQHTQFSNQGTAGGGSSDLKRHLNNVGNNQYGVSYSSSEENIHQTGKGYTSEEEPIQLFLVEEDVPGQKNLNNDGVYYLQYDNSNPSSVENSQEQSYLILDDSTVQQNPKLKVMVDGGKDLTYPIRNLAKVGLHVARSVLPQIPQIKKERVKDKKSGKVISGKINFGIEFKKEKDRSSDYIQSRIDKNSEAVSDSSENEQNTERKTEELQSKDSIQSRIDNESEMTAEKSENKPNATSNLVDLQSEIGKENEQKLVNNHSSQKEDIKSR